MSRVLVWLVLFGVIWWLLRRPRVPPPGASGTPPRPSPPPAPQLVQMVDCAHCGLHFPASEAVRDGARLFCCGAHRDAGPRRGE